MKINNVKIDFFNAILNTFTYASSNIETDIYNSGLNHLVLSQSITPQSRALTLTFVSEKDISEFTSHLLTSSIMDTEDGYLFDILLSGTPTTKHIGCDIYEVSYPLSTIKKGYLQRFSINKLIEHIHIMGNQKTYPIITITPKKALSSINVMGIAITNLKQGKKVVIDSMNKLIEEDGKNKFSETNIKQWPYLSPGIQTISKSTLDVEVSLEYYPLYI